MGSRLVRALALGLLVIGIGLSIVGPVGSVVSAPASQVASIVLTPVITGLMQPVFVTHPGDGTDRLFIVERGGVIKISVDGQVRPVPFLDITPLVRSNGTEQGLLGLAFHPEYVNNGLFFVYYTSVSGGANTLARYRVSSDPNLADAASASVLLAVADTRDNHNGGMLAFGQDGYLYVGLGDGGGVGDPDANGQNRNVLFGKLLRLDVNAVGAPYGIPPSNPFVNVPQTRGEIWAYGLRNPWRFSFDRATGDLYLGDVGQNTYEEVDYQPFGTPGGQNYGWRLMEGLHCYNPTNCSQAGLTLPIFEYTQTGGNCSITGGYVYRGRRAPSLIGAYVYADYCTGRISALRKVGTTWTSTLLLDTPSRISTFGEDRDGELYVAEYGDGRISRLEEPTAPTPTPLPALGGRGLRLQVAPPVLSWADGASETGYFGLRWQASGGVTFFPESGAPLWSTATAWTDRSVLNDQAYCYLIMPTAGLPAALTGVQGLSDFLCWWPNTGTGKNPPRQLSIRLDQSNQVRLTWEAPGGQDSYVLVAITFDGAAPRQISLDGAQLTTNDDTQGKSTCYTVVALQGGMGLGATDLVCGVPGIATLGAAGGARRGLGPQMIADRITAAARQLASPPGVSPVRR